MQVAPPQPRHDADVLIPEARQRQRRRRWVSGLALLALVVAVVGYLTIAPHSSPTRPRAAQLPPRASIGAPGSLTSLDRPATLTIGAHGLLYIADDTRNMIFARHPDGRFTVVAGTGRKGFSGDGGPAADAALNHPAGMTYDRATHTLYVADSGNDRIRAINAHGIIRTVAGGGRRAWVRSGTLALQAKLYGMTAVAVSPAGRLFIVDELQLLRLNTSGTLTDIAGLPNRAGVVGIGRRAVDASTDSADGLAFDRHGDLFLTGFATKSLLAITPSGRMRLVSSQSVYPRGDAGIVTAPDGSVIVMQPTKIVRYTSLRSHQTLVNFASTGPIDGVRDVSPNGIAITANGTIYVDTDDRAGYSSATAIIRIPANSQVGHVIWRRS
jgi:DNA-binding beta-propeller fold protein YncE